VGESAWFSIPEVELGIPLSWHALPRLARELGHARALELTALCERFDAKQAHEFGLATHLAPDGGELVRARELAARAVAMPALPLRLTKESMRAIKSSTEQGQVSYGDGDLLLYSRLMQQRARRRAKDE
jgi:enoyl-CoA hydratase/carnithine racemase